MISWRRVAAAGAVSALGAALFSVALTASAAGSASIGAASASGGWAKAEPLPGLAALGDSQFDELDSFACGAAGDCAAGGSYEDRSGAGQAYVATEKNGTWGKARPVPGIAALNAGGVASLGLLSCPSAGNCTGAGQYQKNETDTEAFVVTERNGRWGKGEEVPGTAALNKGSGGTADAQVEQMSCPSAGNCTAAGIYTNGSGKPLVFVVSEANGRWGKAIEAPGFSALSKGTFSAVQSVSCARPRNCTVSGIYSDAHNFNHAFVVTQVRGRWQRAREVLPIARFNTKRKAQVLSIFCTSPGNCSAVGFYEATSVQNQAFVTDEVHGRWGLAHTARMLTSQGGVLDVVVCTSAGNCVAAGTAVVAGGPLGATNLSAVTISERNGRWGKAQEIPGIAALNKGGEANAGTVSCASAGNCAVGGNYLGVTLQRDAFVATEKNGTWGQAIQVPGTATLNHDRDASLDALSCHPRRCDAAGSYTARNNDQVFVTSGP